jgi:hypothetical protein
LGRVSAPYGAEGLFDEGFRGADEDLDRLLRDDHGTVTEELNTSHHALALPLLKLVEVRHRGYPEVMIFGGYRYQLKWDPSQGPQSSPFHDGTWTDLDYELTNLDTGTTFKFSGLVPIMIYLYGFYEGKGTSYRVPPELIHAMFPFLKGQRGPHATPFSPYEDLLEVSGASWKRRTWINGLILQATGRRVRAQVEQRDGSMKELDYVLRRSQFREDGSQTIFGYQNTFQYLIRGNYLSRRGRGQE